MADCRERIPAVRPRRKEVSECNEDNVCGIRLGGIVSERVRRRLVGLGEGLTHPVVVLERFRDEGVDEEREFLFRGWHFYCF